MVIDFVSCATPRQGLGRYAPDFPVVTVSRHNTKHAYSTNETARLNSSIATSWKTTKQSKPASSIPSWPYQGHATKAVISLNPNQRSPKKTIFDTQQLFSSRNITWPHSLTYQNPTASQTDTCAGTQALSVSSAHPTFPCLRSAT